MPIRDTPSVDATRVSSLVALDRSTLGDVLERLETKGWLLRGPSPHDKRIKLIRLSPTGSEVLDGVEAAVHRVQQRLLEPLSPGDRTVLTRMLAQIIQRHEHLPAGPAQ